MKLCTKRLITIINTLLLTAASAFALDFWSNLPNEELAKEITDHMTDTELLSQTFMFGWAGAEPPELLYQWVERGLGSV